MMRLARGLLLAACAAAAAGCGDSSLPTAPSTSAPSTEFFTGTLSPTGSTFYSFTVTNAGAVSITLASTSAARIGAAANPTLALGLGTPSGSDCAASTSADTAPGLNAQLTTADSTAGIYCVSLADPGDLKDDVLFVVRIVHT
jgi:hypothetical protein